jgi:hypothetical protein
MLCQQDKREVKVAPELTLTLIYEQGAQKKWNLLPAHWDRFNLLEQQPAEQKVKSVLNSLRTTLTYSSNNQ